MGATSSFSEEHLDDSWHGDHRTTLRPLQHGKWSKGNDGFLINDIWRGDTGSLVSSTPIIYLQHTEERMYLCIYQHRSLTLMLVIPVSSIISGEQGVSALKQLILDTVSSLVQSSFPSSPLELLIQAVLIYQEKSFFFFFNEDITKKDQKRGEKKGTIYLEKS